MNTTDALVTPYGDGALVDVVDATYLDRPHGEILTQEAGLTKLFESER